MPYIKDNGKGGFQKLNNASGDMTGWTKVEEDDARLSKVKFQNEDLIDYKTKRQRSIADNGYGSWQEQLEMMNERGFDAWQAHCADVKKRFPK